MYNVHLLLQHYFKADESVITTHRSYFAHLMLCWNDAIPDRIFNGIFYPEHNPSDIAWNYMVLFIQCYVGNDAVLNRILNMIFYPEHNPSDIAWNYMVLFIQCYVRMILFWIEFSTWFSIQNRIILRKWEIIWFCSFHVMLEWCCSG